MATANDLLDLMRDLVLDAHACGTAPEVVPAPCRVRVLNRDDVHCLARLFHCRKELVELEVSIIGPARKDGTEPAPKWEFHRMVSEPDGDGRRCWLRAPLEQAVFTVHNRKDWETVQRPALLSGMKKLAQMRESDEVSDDAAGRAKGREE